MYVRLELVNSHAHANIGIFHHLGELLKANLAVLVEVGLHDGLVHDLLQLLVLKVAANHHLEDNEKLSVADVSIAVNVIDLEGELKLLLLVSLAAERRKTCNELLEIDITTTILIKDGNHSCCQRVGRDLRKTEEFIALDRTGVILVQFHESLSQTINFFSVEVGSLDEVVQDCAGGVAHVGNVKRIRKVRGKALLRPKSEFVVVDAERI
jgi:hypothetical protein